MTYFRNCVRTAVVTMAVVAVGVPAAAQFTTVINVPPDAAPTSVRSYTQLNIWDGGFLPDRFRAGSAYISNHDIEVNIAGGSVGNFFEVNSGAAVTISGGRIGSGITAAPGSEVTLVGGDFMLNGRAYFGGSVMPTESDVLTGTLEDGTPFVFSPLAGDAFRGVMLSRAPLPFADTAPVIVDDDNAPDGLREGQTLTLEEGGTLPENFAAVSATLNIAGGDVGDGLEVVGSQVTISGGNIGSNARAFSGSTVAISGGTIGNFFRANDGSNISISGGTITHGLGARPGSHMTISGGTVYYFGAQSGSNVTISGGSVPRGFFANSGSQVTISGGTFGTDCGAAPGSNVTISGGEFLLNGGAVSGSAVALRGADVLTGTLADGSPFVFSPLASDRLDRVMLSSAPLPVLDTTPMVVDHDSAPKGLRGGQTLTLEQGGILPENFAAVNAVLNIAGGQVGDGLELVGSLATISGGTIGNYISAYSGSEVTVSGGTVGKWFAANSGSVVRISGGTVGDGFNGLEANSGSVIVISGGTIRSLYNESGSQLTISGAEFLLNGAAPPTGPITLSGSDVLTGALEDGSPFIFSPLLNDRLADVTLSSAPLPAADRTPIIISDADAPNGVRNGQTLILENGGTLPEDFLAVNATLDIVGGAAGNGLQVAGSQVTISGGTVGHSFRSFGSDIAISGGEVSHFSAYSGSHATVSGGSVNRLDANSGSDVTISGGSIYSGTARTGGAVILSGGTIDFLVTESGSVVTISGGTTAVTLGATSGSVINISGGTVSSLQAYTGSELNVYGTEFALDGSAIPPPLLGQGATIVARTGELTGLFADGSPFTLHLWQGGEGKDMIPPGALLTITRVSLLQGDYNSDGIVDQGDLDMVLLHWGERLPDPYGTGWINDIPSGVVDQEELDRVLLSWGDTVAAIGTVGVPEPGTALLILLLLPLFLISVWHARFVARRRKGANC